MKVETVHDDEARTVKVTLTVAEQVDPDVAADEAWRAMTFAVEAAQRRVGTIPDGLRTTTPHG